MGIAPQGHETAPQPDPALDKLGADPDPNSWDFVEAQVHTIRPGDAMRLQIFLQQYPQFHDQIIAAAQAQLGNAVVNNAKAREQMTADFRGTPTGEDIRSLSPDAPASPEQPAQVQAAPTPAGPGVVPEAANAEQFRGKAPDPHDWQNVEPLVNAAANANDGALLLKGHPALREEIIDRLSVNLGVEVAAQARQLADAPAATAQPEAEAAKPPPAEAEGPKPGDKPSGADQLVDPAMNDPHMPAWASKALEYNYLRGDSASEFDALTGHLCAYQQDEFALNPIKVAAWQKDHNLVPDGKVGPKTIAAARALHKLVQQHPDDEPLEEQLDDLGKA